MTLLLDQLMDDGHIRVFDKWVKIAWVSDVSRTTGVELDTVILAVGDSEDNLTVLFSATGAI